jgi:serine/threonine protein kinase
MTDAPSDQDPEALQRQVEQRLGTRIEGVGVIKEIVGIGGMATVYRTETDDGDSVAVKLMHEHLADKGTLRNRFLREAKILDQVDHPNAVSVYRRGTADTGEAYFAMELLDGWEVETVWKKKGKQFPVAEALEIGMQALGALHAYHEAEVLHRDLKPSNLFLTKSGTVKLIDFGVARFHEDDQDTQKTRAGTALGTPAYMAPEQAMGKVDMLDRRTDVYGLGAVLFTLLSGRRVHEAESNDETLVMAATQPAESLARHAPDVPTEAVQLVDTALSWDREDRFQSAEQMQRAIADLLDEPQQDLDREEKVSEEEAQEAEEKVSEDVADVVVDITEESIEGMKVMFDRIDQMLQSARMYEWDHDKTQQKARHAFEAFREIMDLDEGECYWQIRPHSFEINGECIWDPDEPFDMVPYNLFLDGFRRIQLRSSLSPREMIQFAEWLTTDPEYDLPPEDDLATVLWDRDMPSVDANLVSTPAVIDPNSDDLLQEQTQSLIDDAQSFLDRDGEGKQLLKAMRTGAYAEAEAMSEESSGEVAGGLGKDFTLHEKGLVDPQRVEQLEGAIEPGSQNWDRRIELIVTELWTETTNPSEDSDFTESIQELVEHYVEIRRLKTLLRILIRTHKHLETPDQRRYFTEALLDEEIVAKLSNAIRQETNPEIDTLEGSEDWGFGAFDQADEEDDEPEGIDEKLLKLYGRLLKFLPESYYDVVLRDVVGASRPFRKTIARYLQRYVTGHEWALADLFDALDTDGIEMLMRIVAHAGTEPAFEVLREMLHDSSELQLRNHALDLLSTKFDLTKERFDLASDLADLFTDAHPEMRLAALELARKREFTRLADAAAERAQSGDFHGLPVAERRTVLQTLVSLSSGKAREVAIEMATGAGWIPDEQRQKSRVLALRFLGEIGADEEALNAARKGTGRWWWNSPEIRDAAETATEQIERRIEGAAE